MPLILPHPEMVPTPVNSCPAAGRAMVSTWASKELKVHALLLRLLTASLKNALTTPGFKVTALVRVMTE